jgi:hypothetical protein
VTGIGRNPYTVPRIASFRADIDRLGRPVAGETDTHDTDPERRSGAKDPIMSAYNH